MRPTRERRGHFRGRGKQPKKNEHIAVNIYPKTYALLVRIVRHTGIDGEETLDRALGLFSIYALRNETPLTQPQTRARRGGPVKQIGQVANSIVNQLTEKALKNERKH